MRETTGGGRAGLGLWVLASALLAPGFAVNAWRAAEESRFATFQRDTEAHVLGRLVRSRQLGLLSDGALTGVGLDEPPRPAARRPWPSPRVVEAQYRAYVEERSFAHYSAYLSQPGGQALVFGALDRALPLAPARRLALFRGATALLTAGVLGLVLVWLRRELGWTAAALAALSILASEWLALIARNLWWSTWAFYLPAAAVMLRASRAGGDEGRRLRCGGVVFAAVAVKCWLNGFEFLTTTLLMTATPLVFLAAVSRPGWRATLRAAFGVTAAAVLAVAALLGLLILQARSATGEWRAGVEHVRTVLVARTVGRPPAPDEAPRRELVPSRAVLLSAHLDETFAAFGPPASGGDGRSIRRAARIRFGDLLGAFAAASAVLVALGRGGRRPTSQRRDLAIVGATWFSLLAPLSWLLVFHRHAYRHPHLDPVVWQMPFTIFGCALVGRTLQAAAGRIAARWRPLGEARTAGPAGGETTVDI